MAHYSISKRVRKNQTVYCARVRSKESGVITFSTPKTFHSKASAIKWAKSMVQKVELLLTRSKREATTSLLHKSIPRHFSNIDEFNKVCKDKH